MIEVSDKFNMVDMGGIDIVKSQGITVDGLFTRLLNAIQQCRYSLLYNWYFAEISIAPTPVELVFDGEKVIINELISIMSDDAVHVTSLEIPAVIRPLSVGENGIFTPPTGVDGFSPVNVNVPQPAPVIQSLSVTENDVYEAPQGVDGFNPVTVNVTTESEYFSRLSPTEYDFDSGGYVGSDGIWYVSGGDGTKVDIYQVEVNKWYTVFLGEFFGNRFRVAFFSSNPAEATANLSGVAIGDIIPRAYASSNAYYAQSNGYIAIGKCNDNTSGISTYAFEISNLV